MRSERNVKDSMANLVDATLIELHDQYHKRDDGFTKNEIRSRLKRYGLNPSEHEFELMLEWAHKTGLVYQCLTEDKYKSLTWTPRKKAVQKDPYVSEGMETLRFNEKLDPSKQTKLF